MIHPALTEGSVAVITGGAAGIGLAAAKKLASLGLRVCIADLGADRLERARTATAKVAKGGDADVMISETDVSRVDQLVALEDAVHRAFGGTNILMNNAGISPRSTALGPTDAWTRILDVN